MIRKSFLFPLFALFTFSMLTGCESIIDTSSHFAVDDIQFDHIFRKNYDEEKIPVYLDDKLVGTWTADGIWTIWIQVKGGELIGDFTQLSGDFKYEAEPGYDEPSIIYDDGLTWPLVSKVEFHEDKARLYPENPDFPFHLTMVNGESELVVYTRYGEYVDSLPSLKGSVRWR